MHLIGPRRIELKEIIPGDYALRVVVVDKPAKKKNRVAAKSINFSIQEQRAQNPGAQ